MLKLYEKKWSKYFDIIIGVLAVLFLAVLFIPKYLWSEEDRLREECRIRLENIYELEIEFFRLTNRFPDSPDEAFMVIQAALESARADSDFFGAETLMIDTSVYVIDTQGDMVARIDTLLTLPESADEFYCPLAHERYTIKIENNRTIYLACPIKKELDPFKITLVEADDSLRNLYAEVVEEDNYEIRTLDALNKITSHQAEIMPELFVIDDRLINDGNLGLVDDLYEEDEDAMVVLMMHQEPDTSDEVVRILPQVNGTIPYSFSLGELKDKIDGTILESPRRWLREDFYERRYLFFTMVDSIHGFIEDGDRSWKYGDQ